MKIVKKHTNKGNKKMKYVAIYQDHDIRKELAVFTSNDDAQLFKESFDRDNSTGGFVSIAGHGSLAHVCCVNTL